jgi:uncharacterized protein (TIGR00375 family)
MEKQETIVDLHIHSHYSRATSKDMNIETLYRWGKMKGIEIMGTGDITHPAWFAELREKLQPTEDGFFTLKPELAKEQDKMLSPLLQKSSIKFLLTVEISNIYSRHDKGRRLHNLIILPNFEKAADFNNQLSRIGNLKSDGRPILGLDSRDLLEITLNTDKEALFIPAHIWTPWFAMFGSKSGFNSISDAFGDLSKEIKVVETGLSSDPFMNWRLSQLDNITLVSDSDAHSPAKLAREANVVKDVENYSQLIRAFKTGNANFVGTIEFFPEEGKYHLDGHRACGIRTKPSETKELRGLCPKCGKPLIVGVEHRVDDLADRPEEYKPIIHKRVEYIIPLMELMAEVEGKSSSTNKKIIQEYTSMVNALGNEFFILRKIDLQGLEQAGGIKLAEAIKRMRNGEVNINPGYDGVFGTIKAFTSKKEIDESVGGQMELL